jgi:hypothetical protein
MNGEAVKEIAALAKAGRAPQVIEVHGQKYLMTPTPQGGYDRTDLDGPGLHVQPVTIRTLSGFVDFVNEVAVQKDHHKRENLVIEVQSPSVVALYTGADETWRGRELVATATFEELLGPSTIEYGKFMDLERFNIALQSVFEDDSERQRVLLVLGTVREEEVRTSTDDGIAQTVVAQAGVVANARTVVPNPVKLRPFRTFREVEQPASLFVLRVKKSEEGGLPRVALFEADGGKWKLDAMGNISTFLADAIVGIPILA